MIIEQYEKESVSRQDGSYYPEQNLLHTNEAKVESVLESDPNQGHINVKPGREMLCQTKPAAASVLLSST